MANETTTEEVPLLHGYLVPGSDKPVPLGVAGQFMSRKIALATLQQTFQKGIPRELRHVSHVTVVALDDDGKPVRPEAVRIQTTIGEMLAPLLGVTVRGPTDGA